MAWKLFDVFDKNLDMAPLLDTSLDYREGRILSDRVNLVEVKVQPNIVSLFADEEFVGIVFFSGGGLIFANAAKATLEQS